MRHIGPDAQDFQAVFGLDGGDSSTTISVVDVQGVVLSAIQGLHLSCQEQRAQISRLEEQLTCLLDRVTKLEDSKN